MRGSHDQVLREMENLNVQLKEEQNRVLGLQNELKHGTATQRTIIEVGTMVSHIRNVYIS